MNSAMVGWTFGFRLTENIETVHDLLNDVKDYISLRKSMAQQIQTWWRKQREKGQSEIGKESHLNWCRALVFMRSRTLKTSITQADLMAEMDKVWKDMVALQDTSEELVKSNQELKRLLLLFVEKNFGPQVITQSLTCMKQAAI